ncbi:MAG: shikimate kinase [Clostridia bacterium]|nr:shikimate kinase [Clostridia bacterium]
MKVLFIFGSGAVGKMTVGQQLTKITDLKLFHNHMTIEPILEIFGEFNTDVILKLRDVIFDSFAHTDKYGLIYTFMWAFNTEEDWQHVEHVKQVFRNVKPDTEFYYVELVADIAVRLMRNATENRLLHKSSKRDIDTSNKRMLREEGKYRLESFEGEIPYDNYIKINNTDIPADVVAQRIKDNFNL